MFRRVLKGVNKLAHNSLAPGFVKLFYNSNGHVHLSVLQVKPFPTLAHPSGWGLDRADGVGSANSWETDITAYVTVLKANMHTSSTFTFAELWTKDTPEADPVFRATAALNIAGTNATAVQAFSQLAYTWRTADGGLLRTYQMEWAAGTSIDFELYPPYSGASLAIFNYLKGDSAVVFGRDNSRVIAGVRVLSKTNDALRKKYMLDA